MAGSGAAEPRRGQHPPSSLGLLDLSAQPPLEPVVEIETIVGPMLGPRGDQMVTAHLSLWGVWERVETRYVEANLRAGDTFVDVGAHIGYFSVLAAKLVGPTGTVIAVEPERRNRDLLHRNLVRNGCHMAQVIPFAAGSTEGAMSLALDEENRGAHRLVDPGDADARDCVRCVRLDDVLPERVDFIKIDAQGYDHDVIEGLEHTLGANREAIVLAEISCVELDRRGLDRAVVLARYEELGFSLSMFGRGGGLCASSAEEILAYAADPSSPEDFSLVLECLASGPFRVDSCPIQAERLEINESAEGELTVSQPARLRWHQLNHTAALVFDLCTGENSVASIVQLVQAVYGLAEPPASHVEECLERMRRERLVT